MNLLADAQIHALNSERAYILKVLDEDDITISEECITFTSLRDDFYHKYAEYLYNFNKEKTIEYIVDRLRLFYFRTPNEFVLSFQPKIESGSLKQNARFCLKFDRSIKDNLDEPV